MAKKEMIADTASGGRALPGDGPMDVIYPRDLIGYGAKPPHPQWPNAARVAVQFVINYEEDGENCVLHGDSASEMFLSEIVGAQPFAGARYMSME